MLIRIVLHSFPKDDISYNIKNLPKLLGRRMVIDKVLLFFFLVLLRFFLIQNNPLEDSKEVEIW